MSTRTNLHFLIISISIGVFASVMSTSMLSIAFPDLIKTFNINYQTLHWRNILFFALFAVGLPFFGKLADHVGARRQFFLGIILFTFATLMSGLVSNWYLFLFFQAFQAIADAMIVPVQVIFIRLCFPENKIGWAFGWFSATLATASLIGPALGGLILKYFTWQFIFYILSGISLIALILSSLSLPKNIPQTSKNKVPFLGGIGLLMMVISLQILFMEQVGPLGKIVCCFMALLGLIAVIYVQVHKKGEASIFPTGAFKNQTFILACIRVFCLFLVTNAIVLYAPSYLRDVHGFPADWIGWVIIIESIIDLFIAGMAGRAADSRPRTALAIGMSLSLAASIFFWFSGHLHHIFWFGLIYLVLGLGGTITMPSQNKIALMAVPPEKTGEFIGFFQLIQFGTGAFAASIFSRIVEGPQQGTISVDGFQMMITIAILLQIIALLTMLFERRNIPSKVNQPT